MKCVIMQPTYLPWLGFFDLIRSADVFVMYDHVQFEKQSWQQRNRIRNKQGDLVLSVSVTHDAGLKRSIRDVKIDHQRSILKKHLSSIKMSYSKAQNFDELYPEIESVYTQPNIFLIDLNLALIRLGMKRMSITKDFIFSSDLSVSGHKVEALIDVCRKVNADQYLSPLGSKAYIDENNLFSVNGIDLSYQDFHHPVYAQLNYPDFISHLSFIDYLFNADQEEAASFGSFNTHH